MDEQRRLNEGMNLDLALELLPNGKYRDARNIRAGYSNNDSLGAIESVLGNVEITNIDIPLNPNQVYKCVGQRQDLTANKVYYLLYNDTGAHRIMEYDVATSSLNTVLIDVQLNFNPDFLVTGINVVYLNPDTPLLYWTDGGAPNGLPDPLCGSTLLENPPRKIDIKKAKQYMLGNTNPNEAYQVIDVQTLDAIKWPSPVSPIVQTINDTAFNKNNLIGKIYRFKSALGYDNYEQSATSSISKLAIPVGNEFIGNAFVPLGYLNNAIDVTVETGAETAKKIYLYVQQSNIAENAKGDFFLWLAIDKYNANGSVIIPSNSTITVRFYDDKTLAAVLVKYSDLPFDYLPKTAKGQEYIDGNIIVYPNTKEQFNLPVPNVQFTPIYTDLPIPISINPAFIVYTNTDISGNTVTTLRLGPTIPILGPGFYFPVGTVFDFGSKYGQYVVQAVDLSNFNTLLTAIGLFLLSKGALSFIVGPTSIPPLTLNQMQFTSNGVVSVAITAASSIVKYQTFKSGATHPMGIVYYNRANQSTTVVRDETMDVYVDFITEQPQNPPFIFFKQVNMGWAIGNTPPIEATHYQIVEAPNSSIQKFIQFAIKSYITGSTQTQINLTPILDYAASYPNSILSYTYTTGDRCRIMVAINGGGVPNTYIDVSVNSFDETTNILSVDKLVGLTLDEGSLIEIYTPKQKLAADEVFYYEIGEIFEIGDAGLPTRYHKGQIQDQTPTQPATGIIVGGDAWIKERQMSTTNATTFVTYYVEDYNLSDFYTSTVWNRGRPNIFDPNYSEVHLIAKIPFSQFLIPNSQVNGLNTFYADDYKEYDQKYRSIQLVKSKNRRLICFQELKVGIIPVNQRMSYDNIGNEILAETDQVLNPIVYMTRENGIGLNPESYSENGNVWYFADTIHGDIIRSSQDGLTAISDYGLHNYITNLFGRIQGKKVNIYGVYNQRFDQVEFAVEQTDLGNDIIAAETFAWFENGNFWASYYDYHPEMMSQTNSDIVTFKNGRAWLHNQGTIYNNFYGVQYNSDIKVVSNATPSNNTVHHQITINSNRVPEIPDVVTSLNQLSFIRPTMFEVKEGKYYAYFRRDVNTVGKSLPYVNGNRLRGRYLVANIRIARAEYARLFDVTFDYKPSPIIK